MNTTVLQPEAIGERVRCLKDQALESTPSLCAERAALITDAWFSSPSLPAIRRRAEGLAAILRQMTVFIAEDELLVGNQASAIRAAPVFPEYAVAWLVEELDGLPDRTADPFQISTETRSELLRIVPRWTGNTHEDRVLATLPREVLRGWKEVKAFNLVPLTCCGPGHLAVDFPTVLGEGLRGIMGRADRQLACLDLAEPEDQDKVSFLESVLVVCQAVIDFSRRYARLARALATSEQREGRRRELLEMADICERVPEMPATTLREALQSTWFVQLALQIESSGHSVSLGRIDQYLYPYFRADREVGRVSEVQAAELLACLWVKLFWINKVRPWNNTQYAAGYPMYQNATIGGQTPQAADATNELTYLCLAAMDATRLPAPNLSARFCRTSPEIYLRSCTDLIARGFGMPAMENDDAIVPSLLARGVSLEDAYNYCMVGCVEVAVPGKWGYRCNGMTFLNFMKVLELALNGGRDPATNVCLLPGNGDLASFGSFDELLTEWRRQLSYYTRLTVIGDSMVDASLEELAPDPFCSALVQDCIGRGKSLNQGGAIYDMISGSQIGIANVANCLAALKKLVFEGKTISGQELAAALRKNFAGSDGEEIRQLLVNKAPKYGNDDDYVDLLAAGAYGDFIREIARYRNRRYGKGPIGGNYFSSTSTVSSNVPAGMAVGATPDGRLAGESLAEGSSPHMGTDVLGPTAAIKSLAKLPTLLITGGQNLNLKFSPDVMSGSGLLRMVGLLRAFAELRGWHIQFNVVSSQTLRDAQIHPERYRNLMVRVAGYCALFTTIDKATQDNIISRSEHRFG